MDQSGCKSTIYSAAKPVLQISNALTERAKMIPRTYRSKAPFIELEQCEGGRLQKWCTVRKGDEQPWSMVTSERAFKREEPEHNMRFPPGVMKSQVLQ